LRLCALASKKKKEKRTKRQEARGKNQEVYVTFLACLLQEGFSHLASTIQISISQK
jgi:hypothetical protein